MSGDGNDKLYEMSQAQFCKSVGCIFTRLIEALGNLETRAENHDLYLDILQESILELEEAALDDRMRKHPTQIPITPEP